MKKTLKIESETLEMLHELKRSAQSKSLDSTINLLALEHQELQGSALTPETVKQLEQVYGVGIPNVDGFVKSFLVNKHDEGVTKLSKRSKGIYGAALRKELSQEDALVMAEEHQAINNIMVNADTEGKPNVTLGSVVRAFQKMQDEIYAIKLEGK